MRSKKGENNRQNGSQNIKTAAGEVRCTFATLVKIDTVFWVALVKWLHPISSDTEIKSFNSAIEALGFDIDQSISSEYQLFVKDSAISKVEWKSMVSILITRCNKESCDVFIEVRSGEPTLKKDTRCELKAKELKVALEQNVRSESN